MNELWRYRWLKSSQSSKQNSRRSNRSSICNNSPTRVQRKCVPGKFVSCRIEDTLEIQRVYVCVRVQRMVDEKVDVCVCVCARVCVCVMLAETPIYTEKYIYIYKIYIYSGAMEGWFGGGNVIVQFRAASTIRALPSRRTNAYSAGNFVKEARRFRCHRDSGALQLDCSLITLRI